MNVKRWWYSKTLWLAALQFVAGGVMSVSVAHPELGWLIMLKSVVDITLRFFTEQPIA